MSNPAATTPAATVQTPGTMSGHGVKIVGFTLAGLALIGVSRVLPSLAVWFSIALVAGVAISKNKEISDLVNLYLSQLGASESGPPTIEPGTSAHIPPHVIPRLVG